MRRALAASVAAALLLASAVLVGCAGDADEPLFLTPTSTATEGSGAAGAEPTATGGPAAETPSQSPAPEATTATASPTPTPEPVLEGDDLPLPEGSPLGAAHLVAVEAAGWEVVGMPGDIDAVCPSTSVEGVAYGFLPSEGGTGQVFVLWAYPNGDALQQDWTVGARVEPLTPGCDLGTGHVYWNRNLLLAFVPQEGGSAPDPGLREAFLELRP